MGHWERRVATGRPKPIAQYFYTSLTVASPFPNSLEKVTKELLLTYRVAPFPANGLLSRLQSGRTCSSELGHKMAQCS